MWNPFRQATKAQPVTLSAEQSVQQHAAEIRHWAHYFFGNLIMRASEPGHTKNLFVQAPDSFITLGYNGEGTDYELVVSAIHELLPDVQVVTKYLGRLDRATLERLDPAKPILEFETGPSTEDEPNICDFRFWPPESSRAKIDETLAFIG